jgi:hypothetical protein
MDGDDEDELVREKAANTDGERSVAGSDAGSEQGSVAGSDNSAANAQGQAKKREPAKRFRETMKQMADRVRDFMKVPRSCLCLLLSADSIPDWKTPPQK